MWLSNIISGWRHRNDKPSASVLTRRNACADCSFNSTHKRGLFYRLFPAVCLLCKCDVKAKTACTLCSCPLNKWHAITSIEEILKDLDKKVW